MPLDNPNGAPIGDLQILVDTRDRICGPDAWIKGRYTDGDRRCLVAALSLACGSPRFDAPNHTELRLARLLAKQLPPEAPWWTRFRLITARQRLMSFNDHLRTTQEE